MLLLGRYVDSHFVFLRFIFSLTCQEKQCLGLVSAHTCEWFWEPPAPAACPNPCCRAGHSNSRHIAGNFEPFADA